MQPGDARRIAFGRLMAFAADWVIVALWGGLIFGIVMVATGGDPLRPADRWTAQAIGFISMTVPVVVYFALCESSRWRASVGKRLVGLVVVRPTGEPLDFGRALLRNAVRFVPWELGHTVAQQAIYSGAAAAPAWLWIAAAAAMAVPVWWVVVLLAAGYSPYDRWTETEVTLPEHPGGRDR